jgi:protein-S-isoprenylcysteine O-methyltransferase Ste14
MKDRLIASTVAFILVCLIVAAPIVMLFALQRMPNTFFWGIPIGVFLGGLSWIYLSRNWDPVDLSFKQTKTTKQRNWGPAAFIVALVILRTVLVTYTEDGGILLGSVLLFWFLSTGFYMIFRAWWHHLE